MKDKIDHLVESDCSSNNQEKVQNVISITAQEIGDENAIITSILSPSGKEVKITGDVDDAMKLALESKSMVLTPEEDKKLVRKIDLYMFPLMSLLYAVQFMDKVSNSNAAIMGLRTDLKMHGDQYSWVGSAFYFGYMLGLFLLPPVMQRTKYLMKLLCCIIMLWGMVLAVQGSPGINYASFIFLRCLLGFLESAVTPAFTVITSQYWKKEEQFLRICIWFGFNGLGGMWGAAIAYGLFIHQGSYAIAEWRMVFIITGCITIFVGMCMIVHLPDSPDKAWFLSKKEKLQLVERIRGNQQGFGNHHIKKHQIWEALKDVRTWLYFLYSVSSDIPNGGMTNFQSILLKEDFKFDTRKTLLISIGHASVEWVGCPLIGVLSYMCYKKNVKYLNTRLSWAFMTTVLVLIGVCCLAFAKHNKHARLFGVFIFGISPIAFICVLSSISSNTLGYTKKWTVSSINLLAYAAANIAGPHTFIDSQAPDYNGAKVAMVVCYAAELFIIALIFLVNIRENKRRDKIAAEKGEDSVTVENIEFADLTDFENPKFRYIL